jgi:very-short-patch-repair endonuclease
MMLVGAKIRGTAYPPLEGGGSPSAGELSLACRWRGGVTTMAKRSIDSFRRDTARWLRLNQTDAEARLWRRLRNWPMQGTHFRRQVPIGPYIVDFACMAAHLVIEMDGSRHGVGENVVRDKARTRWLEAAGYRVIRFWNNDLINNMDGVLESIYSAVHGSTIAEPTPFKHKRRERIDTAGKPDDHPTPARTQPSKLG